MLFWLLPFLALGEEQWRVIEFINKCPQHVDVVSVINPDPAVLPPGDPVCYARGSECKQKHDGGGCTCTAGVIASVGSGQTVAFKEQLSFINNQWQRPSVNYRPDFQGREWGKWSDGSPAEFTFIQNLDWYDISMIPPGCRSGHWNQFENDYCYGDGGGKNVGGITCFDSQTCFNKGGSIAPGSTNGGLPPPSSGGWYCAMPQVFQYQGQNVYPCRRYDSNDWFASKVAGSCENLFDNTFAENALNHVRSEAFQCCWRQGQADRGSNASPGISASFLIQAMGPNGPISSQCQDRPCYIDFTQSPDKWVTTDGCKYGYQYPYDDFYSTQTCVPPETYNPQLGISAKTYRITYCPDGKPPSPGPTPTPGPGPSGDACDSSVCSWEQCGGAVPWVCTGGPAKGGCSGAKWNVDGACSGSCNASNCRKESGLQPNATIIEKPMRHKK